MKNLRVTGITLKQDRKVYLSDLWTLVNPVTIFSALISAPKTPLYLEYSKKRASIEQLYYTGRNLDKDEVIISEDIAKELGVTVGDKINIKVKIFGKINNDYIFLYEKKPKQFIKYFSEQSATDKKKILKELLERDIVNEEVISYLDKHESKLIREVGLE
jgi:hypothetical protein